MTTLTWWLTSVCLITPTNKVSRGTNFRRALLSHLSVEEAIEKGLKKFVNKQEELLRVQGS
jgi:hypothetical protein